MSEESVFAKEYSEAGLWDKIKKVARIAGAQVIEVVLTLLYTLLSDKTPAKAKAIIIGALGYFISPLDAVPDVLVGIGYTDDLGVLLAALTAVSAHVTDEIRARAKAKANELLGG